MGISKRPKEIWKSPPSVGRRWVEVSNLGRLRTLDHRVSYSRVERGSLRVRSKDSRGRCQVGFSWNGEQTNYFVHRLVAECFVPNPNPDRYDCVFFRNGDFNDCRAENLVWGSRAAKSYRARGKSIWYRIAVFQGTRKIGEYNGCGEVARQIGVSRQAVWDAMRHSKECQGYRLEVARILPNGAKPRSMDEATKYDANYHQPKELDIPDACYTDENVDITPRQCPRSDIS